MNIYILLLDLINIFDCWPTRRACRLAQLADPMERYYTRARSPLRVYVFTRVHSGFLSCDFSVLRLDSVG